MSHLDIEDAAERQARAARLAAELASELRNVQASVNEVRKARRMPPLRAVDIAGLVGRQQPWWSKITSGVVRQPDVEVLERLLLKLKTRRQDVDRIVDIAVRLNACYVRYVRKRGDDCDLEAIGRRVDELTRLLQAAFAASALRASDLVERVGVDQSNLSKVLNGKRQRPNVALCRALTVALEMSEADARRVNALALELSRM